jgi:hypothetical protein
MDAMAAREGTGHFPYFGNSSSGRLLPSISERRNRTPFEWQLPDFLGPDFRFFSRGRLGRKIMKLGNEELFPHFLKIKGLEAQRCPVPFHIDSNQLC